VFAEVNLKILHILLVILLCSTHLYAGQALVLTEIEGIQEKIWYLQRDLTVQKSLLEKYQKQLELLTSKTDKSQLDQKEHLTALIQSTTNQQDKTEQTESDLNKLTEALAALSEEVQQQNRTVLEQAGKIGTLEGSLQTLRAEFAAQQASTDQARTAIDQALAEARQQLVETRSQLDTLSQNTGTRIEQISLWGGGAALFLAILLTIILTFRKSPVKKTPSERKPSQKHEM
jgi:chromosome segregation ATPase